MNRCIGMNIRQAEFFIAWAYDWERIGEESINIEKVNGVVFRYKGKLLGARIDFNGVNFAWWTIDIKTGLIIGVTGFNPCTKGNEAEIDLMLEDFHEIEEKARNKRFAEAMERMYDKHPDIKRQVFGE